MCQASEQIFLQGSYTNNQQTHEKVLNLISNSGNANQNRSRYHLTPTRMTEIFFNEEQLVLSRCREMGMPIPCRWERNLV